MMASDAEPAQTVMATTEVNLSPAEHEFLMRLRNLRKQAGDGVIRLELNVSRARMELIDARPLKREVYA